MSKLFGKFILVALLALLGSVGAHAQCSNYRVVTGIGTEQDCIAGAAIQQGYIVSLNASNQIVPITANATLGTLGIATQSGSVGAQVTVLLAGISTNGLSVDNACAVSNIVEVSPTANGNGHCVSSNPATQVVGVATSSSASASSISVQLGIGSAAAAAGGGITSLNGLNTVSQTFANDTNVTMVSAGSTHTITWAGTLAAARLNGNVVQSIVNDTNVTGSISAQALTLAWSGTLAKARQFGTTVYTDQNNTFGAFTHDFSGAAHTLPQKTGLTANKPATCTVGETYFATDATAGQNIFYCTATNTFTQQLNSGGGFANPMTTLGDTLVENATPAAARLPGPTTPNGVPQVLTSTPAAGVATAQVWALSGVPTNAQTGTSYTIAVADRAGYVSFSNAAAIAVTLPQAGTAGFGSNFVFVACDIGAGTATITPTTSTISYTNGSAYTSAAATLALTTGQCAWIYSDNTNYFAILRSGGAGSSAWSALTNPSGNLVLSTMGTNTTTFDYATALANAWIWANNTAATSGTSQSSPLIYLCGQGWETATPANTQDCYSLQTVIPNGANSQPLLTVVNTGGSTNGNSPSVQLPGQLYMVNGPFNSVGIGAQGSRTAELSSDGIYIGSSARGVVFYNAGNIDSGAIDGNLTRLAPGLLSVGTGSTGSQAGLLVNANTKRQVTASYTNATTTPSTFQTWTLPALAQNYSYSCHGSYQGSVSTATLALSVNSSVAPTSLMAHARVFSTLTGTSTDATVTSTASGTVAVLTGAAPAANATNYEFYIEGTIEEVAAGGTFAIQAAAGGVGTLTILRGSFCQLY